MAVTPSRRLPIEEVQHGTSGELVVERFPDGDFVTWVLLLDIGYTVSFYWHFCAGRGHITLFLQ
jgi:hypothetical protein